MTMRTETPAPQRSLEILKAMLDAIGLAAFAVTRGARILFANQAGQNLVQRGDTLVARADILSVAQDSQAQRLKYVLEAATERSAPVAGTLRLTGKGGLAYHITVKPVRAGGTAAALLLLRDPDCTDPTLVLRLRSLFNLTAAEARLALALSEGVSVSHYAAQNAVAENTVRSQTKSIAGKMHCSRQAEIVAIVARLPPMGADS